MGPLYVYIGAPLGWLSATRRMAECTLLRIMAVARVNAELTARTAVNLTATNYILIINICCTSRSTFSSTLSPLSYIIVVVAPAELAQNERNLFRPWQQNFRTYFILYIDSGVPININISLEWRAATRETCQIMVRIRWQGNPVAVRSKRLWSTIKIYNQLSVS